MSPEVVDHWERALRALKTAKLLVAEDPDAAASRAYYAAFHAVTALLLLEGKSFQKHSGLETAVHRDLVKARRWPADRGADFSWLSRIRATADYGTGMHVTAAEATDALDRATRMILAIHHDSPDLSTLAAP